MSTATQSPWRTARAVQVGASWYVVTKRMRHVCPHFGAIRRRRRFLDMWRQWGNIGNRLGDWYDFAQPFANRASAEWTIKDALAELERE